MRKLLGLVALVVVGLVAFAGVASATSNKANGANVGGVSLSGIITCSSSTLDGSLTNFAGAGVTVSVTHATSTSCGAGNTVVACNLPWDLHTNTTTDAGTTWHGNITGLCIDMTTFLTGTCRYTGSLTGSYVESTDRLSVSANQPLSNNPNKLGCFSSITPTATYSTTPTDLNIS